jgi:perosamine synthetase
LIPVSAPSLGSRELELVTRCVESGWVSSGSPYVEEFEAGWASYCGSRYGVAVCNGTAALELGLATLGVGPGDEVVMPSLTIISCALAAVRLGAVPVLIDSDPQTWCIDVDRVEAAIGHRTRAIMPVHLLGHPVRMDPILELANRHGLSVIEDAAEAHGARYASHAGGDAESWRQCGAMGDLGVFSFYANKVVTTGEGGMLVTDDPELAARARSLRDLAHVPGRRFRHEELGFNFRLSGIQAALGVAQLEQVDEVLARKRGIADFYEQRLGGRPELQLSPEEPWAQRVYWMYAIVAREGERSNDLVAERLAELGVQSRPFFLGLHEQPALAGRFRLGAGPLPVTERLSRYGFYVPSGPVLTDAELETVAHAIEVVFDES